LKIIGEDNGPYVSTELRDFKKKRQQKSVEKSDLNINTTFGIRSQG
jgi:hypothetical protein